MSAIDAKGLARGIALVISLATAQAGACELHTMTLNGFETAHPASITVSLATRQAIDNKRIRDIPRGTRESRLSALANIEEKFHAFGLVTQNLETARAPVFSIYLTESDHWARFVPAELGWTLQMHRTNADNSAVIIIVSDTAMKGLLLNQLSIKDAQELGVLVPVGSEANRFRVLAVVQDFLRRFHDRRIQNASLK